MGDTGLYYNNYINYSNRGIHTDYYYHHITQVLRIFKQPFASLIFSPAQHDDTHQVIPSDLRMLNVIFGCSTNPHATSPMIVLTAEAYTSTRKHYLRICIPTIIFVIRRTIPAKPLIEISQPPQPEHSPPWRSSHPSQSAQTFFLAQARIPKK